MSRLISRAALVALQDSPRDPNRRERKQIIAIAGIRHCLADDLNRQAGERHDMRVCIFRAAFRQSPFARLEVDLVARHAGDLADPLAGGEA